MSNPVPVPARPAVPSTYLADRLARLVAVRNSLQLSIEELRAIYDDSDSWARLGAVLPGASLTSGKRCTVEVGEWHATTSYSRPVLSARFSATVNGKDYSGSAELRAEYWSRGEKLDEPRIAAGVSSYGSSFTDSACRLLVEAIESHYSHQVTPVQIATWSALSVAQSDVLRWYGEVVRSGDARRAELAIERARDFIEHGCTVDQYDGQWFPIGPDGRRVGHGWASRVDALKAGRALLK